MSGCGGLKRPRSGLGCSAIGEVFVSLRSNISFQKRRTLQHLTYRDFRRGTWREKCTVECLSRSECVKTTGEPSV